MKRIKNKKYKKYNRNVNRNVNQNAKPIIDKAKYINETVQRAHSIFIAIDNYSNLVEEIKTLNDKQLIENAERFFNLMVEHANLEQKRLF